MSFQVAVGGITINTPSASAMGGGTAEGKATVHLVMSFDREQVTVDVQHSFTSLEGLMADVKAQLVAYGKEMAEAGEYLRA
jgi:hypothetical protein